VVKFLVALAIGYKTLAGVTWYQAFQFALDYVPRPKPISEWTPEETQRWLDRANPDPNR
jgi:hypothetical protein